MKMSTYEEMYVDGKLIRDLRVVDLKEQLEKRGVSKSGNKNDLVKRLKEQLAVERMQEAQLANPSSAPNMEMKACGSNLVAEYLEKQQQMLQAAMMAGTRTAAASASDPLSDVQDPSVQDYSSGAASDSDHVQQTSPKRQKRGKKQKDEPALSGDVQAATVVQSPLFEQARIQADLSPPVIVESARAPIQSIPEIFPGETVGTTKKNNFSDMQIQENILENVESRISEPKNEISMVVTEQITTVTTTVVQEVVRMERSRSPSPVAEEKNLFSKDDEDEKSEKFEEDVSEEREAESRKSPSDDGRGEDQGDDSNGAVATTTRTVEEEEVEMEISAPVDAVDEIFEAVNTARAPAQERRLSEKEERTARVDKGKEQENNDIPQRKRKWVASTFAKRTTVSISSDSLKEIVGPVKDSLLSENSEEHKMRTVEVVESTPPPKRIVITRDDGEENEEDGTVDENDSKVVRDGIPEPVVSETAVTTEEGLIRVRSPSPARHPPGNIIHIHCLTRPFTIASLHELLSKFGTISKEEFWIDGIKSHCFAKYSNEEEATLARNKIHNTKWPPSNPKVLRVDFASQDDLDRRKNEAVSRVSTQRSVEEAKPIRDVREARTSENEKGRGARGSSTDRDKPRDREWDRGKLWRAGDSPPTDPQGAGIRQRSQSPDRKREVKYEQQGPPQPAKLLDELFRKTKAMPSIYWLPLTDEQSKDKEQYRKKREQERRERVKKLEDDERDRRRDRRHSPFDYPRGGRRR